VEEAAKKAGSKAGNRYFLIEASVASSAESGSTLHVRMLGDIWRAKVFSGNSTRKIENFDKPSMS
jgi:hypothetical protein